MPSTLGRNFNLCFTKIKRHDTATPLTPGDHSRPFSSSSTAAAIHFKNFNSLYDDRRTFDFSTSKSLTPSSDSSEPDDGDTESEPDFATVFASQRFFFTSPGSSNSIVESTPSIATPESSNSLANAASPVVNHPNQSSTSNGYDHQQCESLESWSPPQPPIVESSVAVPTFSPDPYMDFRRSMQEMVEARCLNDVNANWDYLHELLLCYLALNPKSAHKVIIGAFADLLVTLMSSTSTTASPEENGSRNSDQLSAGGGRISEQCACNV